MPPVDLTGGSHDQEHAGTATSAAAAASQVRASAVEEDGKAGSDAVQGDEMEKVKAEKDVYKGMGAGVDGAGGDPEDEKELEALAVLTPGTVR